MTATTSIALLAGNGGSVGYGTTPAAGVPAPSSAASPPPPTTGPPTTTVVASVVGSVAGLAVVLLVALALLRWRRRHGGGMRLLLSDGDGDAASNFRAIGAPPGEGGGGGGAAMADRGLSVDAAAALASLPGNRRPSQPQSAESGEGERGFYRVSGKRLPSVLRHGGDGYSDPRDSTISGTSAYRDSQGWWDGPDAPRFAVGSPMRPESGVAVVKPSPARTPVQTPVTEHAPILGYDHELMPRPR